MSPGAEVGPDVPCIACILSHNTASRRVAQRVGLTDYGLRNDASDG